MTIMHFHVLAWSILLNMTELNVSSESYHLQSCRHCSSDHQFNWTRCLFGNADISYPFPRAEAHHDCQSSLLLRATAGTDAYIYIYFVVFRQAQYCKVHSTTIYHDMRLYPSHWWHYRQELPVSKEEEKKEEVKKETFVYTNLQISYAVYIECECLEFLIFMLH